MVEIGGLVDFQTVRTQKLLTFDSGNSRFIISSQEPLDVPSFKGTEQPSGFLLCFIPFFDLSVKYHNKVSLYSGRTLNSNHLTVMALDDLISERVFTFGS